MGKIIDSISYIPEDYEVNIVRENRQLAIRIPQKIVNKLKISPEIHKYKFILNEEEGTLTGELFKKDEKE